METYYSINFTYPNGHTDEIEETFKDLESAIAFGNSVLVQVGQTERFHQFNEETVPPHFDIYLNSDEGRSLAYRSLK